ncbi:hypothetical protein [Shouchella shacheensis]|uniref:hypothetical protein n=1 Tax=Shouchella shacheensis TaxID=1649580 RepID=UPI003F5A0596
MTFGFLLEFSKRGYNVPKDMRLASYGEIDAAPLLKNSEIISIKQSPYAMGNKVGEMLLERLIKNNKHSKSSERYYEVFQTTIR